MNRWKATLAALSICMVLFSGTSEADGPVPYRWVTASEDHIVFSYAYDLWIVEREGGEARRLTDSENLDMECAFSPDGSSVAFTRFHGGNNDVFTIDISSGELKRLTWHPKPDHVRGWWPDGSRVIFASGRTGDRPFRLWHIDTTGQHAELFPLPYGEYASLSPDASHLAYISWDVIDTFRNFRGGRTTPILIADLSDSATSSLEHGDGANNTYPWWHEDAVYFVSDRDGTFNLFRHNVRTNATDQLTHFEKWDIRFAQGSGGAYAFVQNGSVHVVDYQSGAVERVAISLPAETLTLEPYTVNPMQWLNNIQISPDGQTALVEARGDVITINIESGDWANLTDSSGAAEREPKWSPDGRNICWFSDADGTYQLHVYTPASGETRVFPIAEGGGYYEEPLWSPDGSHVLFYDAAFRLHLFNVAEGSDRIIARSPSPYQEEYQPVWSPDSAWIAFCRFDASNIRQIHLYSVASGEAGVVSDPFLIAESPAFDANGQYLYYLQGNASTAPAQALGSASMLYRANAKKEVVAVALRADASSPLFPDEAVDKPANGEIRIELEGIEHRRLVLESLGERNFRALHAAGAGSFYLLEHLEPGEIGTDNKDPLYRVTLSQGEPKVETVLRGLRSFEISTDGSRLLAFMGGGIGYADLVGETAGELKQINTDTVSKTIDQREEWRQIMREALRIQKHYFYAPNLHGQDLDMLLEHFLPYVENTATRRTLSAPLTEMVSHFSISHMFASGGDYHGGGEREWIASLGIDVEPADGRYRITGIYRGDGSRTLLTGPLSSIGVEASVGDYIISLQDVEVTTDRNFYSYLVMERPGPLQITLSKNADGSDARSFTVMPSPGTNTLRTWSWIDENRRRVEEASDGRLAYIYIPDFGPRGIEAFVKQYWAQQDREGIVLDHRFSPGGSPGDYHVETLLRKAYSYYSFRHGQDQPFPSGIIPGPRVLLVNEWNASSTDTFPAMFKTAGVGTIVGKRTMGAGIGGWHSLPRLIDGGRVASPNRAYYEPGDWAIENIGIAPHVEVDLDTAAWRNGVDTQLEAAIRIAMEQLPDKTKDPNRHRPPYPSYR